jgi:hypothetical protein
MELLTQEIRAKLPKLYSTENIDTEDKILVVKFFTPDAQWTWYAVEFDGDDTFFGFVQGMEEEWGNFSLKELEEAMGPLGLGIERDIFFEPTKFGELFN